MRGLIFPACIALGISLFAVFFRFNLPVLGSYLSLAVPDIVIGLLLLYALIRNRLTIRSPVVYATLFLALVVFLSGAVNAWTDRTFDQANF